MNSEIFQLLGIIAIIVMVVFLYYYYFNKRQIVKRKLKKTITTKMSDFQNGEIAKIVGQVEIIGEPLIAPLSKRKCAYYYVLIERQLSSGKLETIIEEEITGTFIIKDGRNIAYVNGENIKSYIVQDRIYTTGHFNNPTENLEKYLCKHGLETEGILGFNEILRYKEGVLESGETIAVIGKGEWKRAEQEKLPDNYGRILSITSTNAQPIYLSDDPETVRNINFNN